jgi:predicted nucleic acid-binding protein
MGIVVDTSAFVKLFYNEKNSLEMDALMQLLIKQGEPIFSMDLILYELGQIVFRKHQMKFVMARDFPQRLSAMTVNVLFPDDKILSKAMDLCRELGTSFYDSSFIALSKQLDLPLITEDKELLKKYDNSMSIKDAHKKYSEMFM